MQTIRVDPLTRVEGHGHVELGLRRGRVHRVRVALTEAPRLFEALVTGRSFAEVPSLVCRICAICSGVHRICVATALEQALNLRIPPLAAQLRELLLLGGHIESHALHLFLLILPDLREVDSILPLLAAGDPCAHQGLELKRLGNRVQELAGGRPIHPINVEVGGVVTRPRHEDLLALRAELDTWPARLAELLAPFTATDAYPSATILQGLPLSVAAPEGFGLQGETLLLGDGRRQATAGYARVLAERPVAHSNARVCATGPYLTGALARALNHPSLHESQTVPAGVGIHANNAAQAGELGWALERCRTLLEALLETPADVPLLTPPTPGPGLGTCAIEAPRGLLVHHYLLDERGRVAAADILTPTAINQRAMEAQLLADLEGCPEGELAKRAQRIVRAYDPCISCAVHLLQLE